MEGEKLVWLQVKVSPELKDRIIERYQQLRRGTISNYVRGLIEDDLATAEQPTPSPVAPVPSAQ